MTQIRTMEDKLMMVSLLIVLRRAWSLSGSLESLIFQYDLNEPMLMPTLLDCVRVGLVFKLLCVYIYVYGDAWILER